MCQDSNDLNDEPENGIIDQKMDVFKLAYGSPDFILKEMKSLANNPDTEYAHGRADDLLVLFLSTIDLEPVREILDAYRKVEKWYA